MQTSEVTVNPAIGSKVVPFCLLHVESYKVTKELLGSPVVPFCPFYLGVSLLETKIVGKRVPLLLRGYWGTYLTKLLQGLCKGSMGYSASEKLYQGYINVLGFLGYLGFSGTCVEGIGVAVSRRVWWYSKTVLEGTCRTAPTNT